MSETPNQLLESLNTLDEHLNSLKNVEPKTQEQLMLEHITSRTKSLKRGIENRKKKVTLDVSWGDYGIEAEDGYPPTTLFFSIDEINDPYQKLSFTKMIENDAFNALFEIEEAQSDSNSGKVNIRIKQFSSEEERSTKGGGGW